MSLVIAPGGACVLGGLAVAFVPDQVEQLVGGFYPRELALIVGPSLAGARSKARSSRHDRRQIRAELGIPARDLGIEGWEDGGPHLITDESAEPIGVDHARRASRRVKRRRSPTGSRAK